MQLGDRLYAGRENGTREIRGRVEKETRVEGEEGKTEETRPKWEWRWVLGMG